MAIKHKKEVQILLEAAHFCLKMTALQLGVLSYIQYMYIHRLCLVSMYSHSVTVRLGCEVAG